MKRNNNTSILTGNSTFVPGRSSFRAAEYDKAGCTTDQIQEIKDCFDLFDSNRSGLIRPADLESCLKSLGTEGTNQAIYRMMRDAAEEGIEDMDFDQFLDLMTQRVSLRDTREDLRKVFNLFDEEKSGFISLKTLQRVIKDLGQTIDDHELQEMIEKADEDCDGKVSEEEFYNIMTKKTCK